MALIHNTDMLYTRAGAAESNVLSAHDPLIWEFEDTALVGGPATATVQFIVKDNDLATIYTSAVFPAYQLSYVDPLAKFRFDGTQILKHIINNYFYKEMSNNVISPENYGSTVDVVFKTYDNAVQNATDTVTYYLSQAVNQIGDEYGSNIPRLFLNDTEDIAHFLGYPNHLFFYSGSDLVAEDPVVEIYDGTENENLITNWINLADSFDTLDTTGKKIDSAIDDGATIAAAQSNILNNVIIGNYFIFSGFLTQNTGTRPSVRIFDSGGFGAISALVQLAAGQNDIVLRITAAADNKIAYCHVFLDPGAATNFDISGVSLTKTAQMSIQSGTLGLHIHDWNLGIMLMKKTIIQAKVLYDEDVRNIIKTYNIKVFDACENAIFIRWLNSNGDYSYWAFSPFPFRNKSGDRLGSVINNFTEMALANSRNLPLGYRDAFDKIAVIASAVPLLFRRKMLEIFTSPAVYLWNGLPSENLISTFINAGYETFESNGVIILSAIETGAYGEVFSADSFDVMRGDQIIVIFDLNLNSGNLPKVALIKAVGYTIASNIVDSATGFNFITLTAIFDTTVLLRLRVFAVSNFSTSAIIVKRKEKESDWILLNRIEGSHNLMLKKDNDNFECTLVLPENYTQQLSGQNI